MSMLTKQLTYHWLLQACKFYKNSCWLCNSAFCMHFDCCIWTMPQIYLQGSWCRRLEEDRQGGGRKPVSIAAGSKVSCPASNILFSNSCVIFCRPSPKVDVSQGSSTATDDRMMPEIDGVGGILRSGCENHWKQGFDFPTCRVRKLHATRATKIKLEATVLILLMLWNINLILSQNACVTTEHSCTGQADSVLSIVSVSENKTCSCCKRPDAGGYPHYWQSSWSHSLMPKILISISIMTWKMASPIATFSSCLESCLPSEYTSWQEIACTCWPYVSALLSFPPAALLSSGMAAKPISLVAAGCISSICRWQLTHRSAGGNWLIDLQIHANLPVHLPLKAASFTRWQTASDTFIA